MNRQLSQYEYQAGEKRIPVMVPVVAHALLISVITLRLLPIFQYFIQMAKRRRVPQPCRTGNCANPNKSLKLSNQT